MNLPRNFYNVTSLIGATLAILSLLTMAFLLLISIIYGHSSNYLGLFIYIIIPVFLVTGLFLIPIGMFFKHRKNKKQENIPVHKWPILDFNTPAYRNALIIFGLGTVFFVFITGIGSYEAFHYTESVKFCGTTCHQVMEPQYTTFQSSPHARIKCVDCHVGEGADWYVKSKLSGLKQVYAVAMNNYPHPIPSPLEELRPARHTCEQCHWPQKFYSHQLRYFKHYLSDSLNSEWNIALKMKIGASHLAGHYTEGIHWHINNDVKIEYIPKSDDRKKIPWVRYINTKTGDTTLYQDKKKPLSEEKIAESTPRLMDCMDCHNRPSHQFQSPPFFIDHALSANEIPHDLPFVKKYAMQVLRDPYESNLKAKEWFNHFFDSVYTDYPDKEKVNTAKEQIAWHFDQNIFSTMGASWDAYESHLGHKSYNGCFRCHDNKHVAENGRVISNQCNLCHDIVKQGRTGMEEVAAFDEYLSFKHPVEVDTDWTKDLCVECHRYLY